MRRKWKIKRIAIFALIILVISIFLVRFYISTTPEGKLRKLDYSKEVIKLMDDDLKVKTIESKTFSQTLSNVILENNYIDDYFDNYFKINYVDLDKFGEYANKLLKLGYEESVINKVFENFKIDDIDKIIEVGYINDLMEYINISYFRPTNFERYISYKEKTQKTYEAVITDINIGLDKEYYDEDFVKTVDDTNSILILVNKYNKLPDGYSPNDLVKISDECSKTESYLRKEAAEAFEKICKASIDEGNSILALSAYRSFDTQIKTWETNMKNFGPSYTYYYVAKPGFSEHQTGLSVDLASGSFPGSKFSFTRDYTWTIKNAHKYGFILRYDEGKEKITGFNFEPWHIRYVGVGVAKYIYDNDITFDEYMAMR